MAAREQKEDITSHLRRHPGRCWVKLAEHYQRWEMFKKQLASSHTLVSASTRLKLWQKPLHVDNRVTQIWHVSMIGITSQY